jgi:hypothetical protein
MEKSQSAKTHLLAYHLQSSCLQGKFVFCFFVWATLLYPKHPDSACGQSNYYGADPIILDVWNQKVHD